MTTSLYRRAARAVGVPLGLWGLFLLLCISPYFQRHFLYLHKVSPWWQDANQPQRWGFAKNQVTPFQLKTDDGESIYAWHVLPLPIYRQHARALQDQPTGFCPDITAAESFRILREDPEAQLIIYFHGNAGHLPNAIRAPSFHSLTDTSRYHLLAIDYRGFGRSSGTPTEDGVIRDAAAAVDFVLETAGVAPHRVVIIGQSLGTAVAAAVAERYARLQAVDFAGVVLVAGFSSLPTMLSGYAIAGWVPILRPLRSWPRLLNWMLGFIVDAWPSADRLRRLVETVRDDPVHRRLYLSLVHTVDDRDIPYVEDDKLFAAAAGPLLDSSSPPIDSSDPRLIEAKAARTIHLGEDAFVTEWRQGGVTLRQELYPYGGHNTVMQYAPVVTEVMRAFDEGQQER